MTHFPHRAIDGSWHVVYRIPGCGSLHSVMQCPCERTAREETQRLNNEQEITA